eukprot:TRINITY_DN3903_c0_g1_i1.p1 TRINITY_DN3903_c0_g1~~TRINITY_DN3903_c0_g1_i1.p1  ORF type:complete len:101 (-),score=26.06 TRINITY_DN3903_c0_g1_i1:56-358(-)
MSSSCQDLREDLRICISESECLKRPGNTFHTCVRSPDLDPACVTLRMGYAECRRGWLDNRKRLYGNSQGHTERQENEEQAKANWGVDWKNVEKRGGELQK